jgi:hypothetical protein
VEFNGEETNSSCKNDQSKVKTPPFQLESIRMNCHGVEWVLSGCWLW